MASLLLRITFSSVKCIVNYLIIGFYQSMIFVFKNSYYTEKHKVTTEIHGEKYNIHTLYSFRVSTIIRVFVAKL